MSTFVEYRVRPVTRFIVTRYERGENGCGVSTIGEYDREDTAHAVGYAMCKQEHDKSGEPVGSMNFIYPTPPVPAECAGIGPTVAGGTFTAADLVA